MYKSLECWRIVELLTFPKFCYQIPSLSSFLCWKVTKDYLGNSIQRQRGWRKLHWWAKRDFVPHLRIYFFFPQISMNKIWVQCVSSQKPWIYLRDILLNLIIFLLFWSSDALSSDPLPFRPACTSNTLQSQEWATLMSQKEKLPVMLLEFFPLPLFLEKCTEESWFLTLNISLNFVQRTAGIPRSLHSEQ